MRKRNVIAVDFDGTLAYDVSHGTSDDTGDPVPEMLHRVKGWVGSGIEVHILTSRMTGPDTDKAHVRQVLQDWCEAHGLPRIPVTGTKWYYFAAYYDDRSVQVLTDTGHLVAGGPTGKAAEELPDGA